MSTKPREPLKAGQKVRLKGFVCLGDGSAVNMDGECARLSDHVSGSLWEARQVGCGTPIWVSASQCTPIRRRERRRIWVAGESVGRIDPIIGGVAQEVCRVHGRDPGTPGWLEFVEVRKGKP